jgi:lipid II:glycine glycyltransferase (peptidoglycan interpeptide bridge formation enzyme)
MFETFLRLYKEMQARKKRLEIYDIDDYAGIQRDLPSALKMRVMLCQHQGEPIAGIALSLFGNTALNLFAATGNKALQLRGSYYLYWHTIEWLKANGYRWFDLNGINAKTSPGTSQFKAGMAGLLGKFTQYLGQFDACEYWKSWYAVRLADRVHETHWWARTRLSEMATPFNRISWRISSTPRIVSTSRFGGKDCGNSEC